MRGVSSVRSMDSNIFPYVGRDGLDRRVARRRADTLASLVNTVDPEVLEGGVGLDGGDRDEERGEGSKAEHGECVR
jgi:hypothetical protein